MEIAANEPRSGLEQPLQILDRLPEGRVRFQGRQIAQVLAEEGVSVVVHGRNQERAEAVVASIRKAGGKADFALGDLTTDEGAPLDAPRRSATGSAHDRTVRCAAANPALAARSAIVSP